MWAKVVKVLLASGILVMPEASFVASFMILIKSFEDMKKSPA